jgi:hypothetical protein
VAPIKPPTRPPSLTPTSLARPLLSFAVVGLDHAVCSQALKDFSVKFCEKSVIGEPVTGEARKDTVKLVTIQADDFNITAVSPQYLLQSLKDEFMARCRSIPNVWHDTMWTPPVARQIASLRYNTFEEEERRGMESVESSDNDWKNEEFNTDEYANEKGDWTGYTVTGTLIPNLNPEWLAQNFSENFLNWCKAHPGKNSLLTSHLPPSLPHCLSHSLDR